MRIIDSRYATTQRYAVGYLTYAVNLVVNNQNLTDCHFVKYYTTPSPSVIWSVITGN
jgi:hypothetical protein